jgi:hypothetical protein
MTQIEVVYVCVTLRNISRQKKKKRVSSKLKVVDI